MSNSTDKPVEFETAIKSLNKIVERLSDGNIALESALKEFEQGIGLIRECQKTLTDAEQKVTILTQKQNDN